MDFDCPYRYDGTLDPPTYFCRRCRNSMGGDMKCSDIRIAGYCPEGYWMAYIYHRIIDIQFEQEMNVGTGTVHNFMVTQGILINAGQHCVPHSKGWEPAVLKLFIGDWQYIE